MAISYHIYANNGQGGAVDYLTPIASTSGLTYTPRLLAAPSDNTFAVRAFDTISGVEEANTDARVRIIIDASGNDVTAQPNAVIGLSARAMGGGTCWLSWGYHSRGQGGPPSTFDVTLTEGPVASLDSLSASISFLPGVTGYGCLLSELASGTLYTIAVRAVGASKELAGPASMVSINYRVASLSNVDSLSATATA